MLATKANVAKFRMKRFMEAFEVFILFQTGISQQKEMRSFFQFPLSADNTS
jgi:hypothetical protein